MKKRVLRIVISGILAAMIAATPVKAATFTDVNTFYGKVYYADAINWGVKHNIVAGYDGYTFGPNDKVTRAQYVTYLYKANGSPRVDLVTTKFKDLPANATFQEAITWAVDKKITSGTTDTTFSPSEGVTRAQAVTFLWRSENSPEARYSSSFSDIRMGAFYAKAVNWAAAEGITSGYTDGRFGINAITNRAQAITFIYKALGNPDDLKPRLVDLYQYLGQPIGTVVNDIGNLTSVGASDGLEYSDNDKTGWIGSLGNDLNSPVDSVEIYSNNPGYSIAGAKTGNATENNITILTDNGLTYKSSDINYNDKRNVTVYNFTYQADNGYQVTMTSVNGITESIVAQIPQTGE